jgi:hypothetical protein
MEVAGELLKILASAIVGAVAVWATEPRRLKTAVEVELVKFRLLDNQTIRQSEQNLEKELRDSERTVLRMRSEHESALQRKEHEILQGLAVDYAKDLREKRIDAYAKLWAAFELLNLYHPKADITYAKLSKLGEELSTWYFSVGGLLLSKPARDAYFEAQDVLTDVVRTAEQHGTMQIVVRAKAEKFTLSEVRALEKDLTSWRPGQTPKSDYLQVRKIFSDLRSKLCSDIGTRAPSVILPGEEAVAPRVSREARLDAQSKLDTQAKLGARADLPIVTSP